MEESVERGEMSENDNFLKFIFKLLVNRNLLKRYIIITTQVLVRNDPVKKLEN